MTLTYGSTVNIGSTYNEKQNQISALAELEKEISAADLDPDAKNTALRNIANAQEELKEKEDPRPEEIGNWLKRAGTAITTANAAASLLSKVDDVMKLFGMSN